MRGGPYGVLVWTSDTGSEKAFRRLRGCGFESRDGAALVSIFVVVVQNSSWPRVVPPRFFFYGRFVGFSNFFLAHIFAYFTMEGQSANNEFK